MKNQNIFLSEKLSELAKINNFNKPCLAYYGDGEDIGGDHYYNTDLDIIKNNYFTAPLYQQVIDWLEDEFKFKIDIKPFNDGDNNIYRGSVTNSENKITNIRFDKSHIILLEKLINVIFQDLSNG